MNRLSRVASAAVFALVLTGCSGGSDRPSVDEISEALQSESTGDESMTSAADCVAEAFHSSDLSDEAIQALVDGDDDYVLSDEDEEVMENLGSDFLIDCLEEDLPQ